MEKGKVEEKFRIKIPQQILDKLNIKTGDQIAINYIDRNTMSFKKIK